jgi:group II intron reverse transcriptase/maturase
MAAVLVLEPIFEADLEPEQYGYRPGRSALDAVRQVERLVRSGHTEVVDGDLSGYFDAIPHAELMKSLSRRISDRFILKLIKMWLEAPVEETDTRGHRHRTTRNKDEGRGSPQGSPISPLLSNIYMRRFVKGWKTGGHDRRLKARIVNYADDFVICCRGTAGDAMAVMQGMMSRLKLTVNEKKTRLCRLPEESFDFLGYTIGRCHSPRTGEAYLGPRPSRKSIQRFCREISELMARRWAPRPVGFQVAEINRKLKGWANYFRLGAVQRAYRLVDNHVRYRLRQWLKAKYKVRGPGKTRFPKDYLYEELGLHSLLGWAGRSPFSDAAMGEFRRQLASKCEWNRKHLVVIDRVFPSSKMCNRCGALNDRLRLSDREWDCDCGAHHRRDFLAACNTKDEGLRLLAVGQTREVKRSGSRCKTRAIGLSASN